MLTGPLRVFGGSVGCQQSPGGGVSRVLRERCGELERSVGTQRFGGGGNGVLRGSVGPEGLGEVLVEGLEESQGGSWCLSWGPQGPSRFGMAGGWCSVGSLKAQCGPWVPRVLVAFPVSSGVPVMVLWSQSSESIPSRVLSILWEGSGHPRRPSESSGSWRRAQ